MKKNTHLLKHILVLLPLSFIQFVLSVFAIALLTTTGTTGVDFIPYLIISLFLFIGSFIPAKVIMYHKNKLNGLCETDAIYFNNKQQKVRIGRFSNWEEPPFWEVLIWIILGPIVLVIEIIAIIAAILSLFIEPLHSEVGVLRYINLKVAPLQYICYYLFGFVIGGDEVEHIPSL